MQVELSDIKLPKHLMRMGASQEGMESLARSIKESGLINPITVRKKGKVYELVAGFRRMGAHELLGRDKIEVLVTDAKAGDLEAIKVAENLEREPVNAVDEGFYFAAMMDAKGMTQKKLAAKIRRSEAYVSQRLAITDWPLGLKEAAHHREINFSVARELAGINDPEAMARCVEHAASGGCTPALAKQWKNDANRAPMAAPVATNGEEGGEPTTHEPAAGLRCDTCGDTHPTEERTFATMCPLCWGTIHSVMKEGVFSQNRLAAGSPPAGTS